MLPDTAYNFYVAEMLRIVVPELIGTQCIAQFAGSLPAGTQEITQYEREVLQGKAKRGGHGQPIPREIAELKRASVVIPEIAHGFYLHRKDLEAAQGTSDLPTGGVEDSTRLVMENLEDLIFNGDANLGIKGIFKDAGANSSTAWSPTGGKEWNVSTVTGADIFNDIVAAAELLAATSRYKAKKMVLPIKAYYQMFKTDTYGRNAAMDLADSGLFPGGVNDILMSPVRENEAQLATTSIIPRDQGLMFDYGNKIAERYVEENINLRMKPENEADMHPFNVVTYQSQKLHRPEAFLALDGLVTY